MNSKLSTKRLARSACTCLILTIACLASYAVQAATNFAAKAESYRGQLCAARAAYWPQAPDIEVLAAQIEQESFWNPRAELKTSREYGFGFFQITVTATFNNFNTVVNQNRMLAEWQWPERFEVPQQFLAGLTLDKAARTVCAPLMAPEALDACMLATYNGGAGGLRSDRRLCANTAGCNPRLWFGNVANTSTKAKTAAKGYGKSFYQINREYVTNILLVRRKKYVGVLSCAKE